MTDKSSGVAMTYNCGLHNYCDVCRLPSQAGIRLSAILRELLGQNKLAMGCFALKSNITSLRVFHIWIILNLLELYARMSGKLANSARQVG